MYHPLTDDEYIIDVLISRRRARGEVGLIIFIKAVMMAA